MCPETRVHPKRKKYKLYHGAQKKPPLTLFIADFDPCFIIHIEKFLRIARLKRERERDTGSVKKYSLRPLLFLRLLNQVAEKYGSACSICANTNHDDTQLSKQFAVGATRSNREKFLVARRHLAMRTWFKQMTLYFYYWAPPFVMGVISDFSWGGGAETAW